MRFTAARSLLAVSWGLLAGAQAQGGRSSLRNGSGVLPLSRPGVLRLSIRRGCSLAQVVPSVGFFLAFSRLLVLVLQGGVNPPAMVTGL